MGRLYWSKSKRTKIRWKLVWISTVCRLPACFVCFLLCLWTRLIRVGESYWRVVEVNRVVILAKVKTFECSSERIRRTNTQRRSRKRHRHGDASECDQCSVELQYQQQWKTANNVCDEWASWSGLEIAVIGLVFLAPKVAFSWPSVDRFGKKFWGPMTLDQVKSVPNFCLFGEKRDIWMEKKFGDLWP